MLELTVAELRDLQQTQLKELEDSKDELLKASAVSEEQAAAHASSIAKIQAKVASLEAEARESASRAVENRKDACADLQSSEEQLAECQAKLADIQRQLESSDQRHLKEMQTVVSKLHVRL